MDHNEKQEVRAAARKAGLRHAARTAAYVVLLALNTSSIVMLCQTDPFMSLMAALGFVAAAYLLILDSYRTASSAERRLACFRYTKSVLDDTAKDYRSLLAEALGTSTGGLDAYLEEHGTTDRHGLAPKAFEGGD